MVQPAEHVVYAIHDYEIPGKGFLPLKAGDVLFVVDADASGWWLGVNLRRQKGVFPSTYTLPYVFPLPPSDLLRDTARLLLAQDFNIDLTSGAPAPLHPLPATPPPCAPAKATLHAEALRAELQDHLLTRETARKAVMAALEELLDARARQQALEQSAAEARKAAEAARARRQVRQQRRCAELRDYVAALEMQKKEGLAKGVVPSMAWYASFAHLTECAMGDAAGVSVTNPCDAVGVDGTERASREVVWRSALRDVKGVVQQQETQLAALSASCAAKEESFTMAAAALQERIEWRDAHVAAMLTYWADAAARAKSTYISCKTEREAATVAHQQEAAQLRRRLEEGRERFTAAKEAYRNLKREAHAISDLLKRQGELDALSKEIAQVDSQIASHQVTA